MPAGRAAKRWASFGKRRSRKSGHRGGMQTPTDFDRARAELSALVRGRSEQIALLRHRQVEVERAESIHAQRRQLQDERRDEAAAALQRRADADADVERQGSALVADWERY